MKAWTLSYGGYAMIIPCENYTTADQQRKLTLLGPKYMVNLENDWNLIYLNWTKIKTSIQPAGD